MARTNVARKHAALQTHEGGRAKRISPIQQLRRTVCSCLLWEREFYESGEAIADRIQTLAGQVGYYTLAELAYEARTAWKLRHIPLYLVAILAKREQEERGTSGPGVDGDLASRVVRRAIGQTIQRADEMGEFLTIYAKLKGIGTDQLKTILTAQMKKGIADAFHHFDAYQLAKYDRDVEVRMRDILKLVRPKPKDEGEEKLWGSLLDGTLKSPDTWEVALSTGAAKKETWERLLREERLGYLALLRNLRGMVKAGVDEDLIKTAIRTRKGAKRVLPFRYTVAARYAPHLEPIIDEALGAAIAELPPLPGKTVVLVDVSGSMGMHLSRKSDLSRRDAAATLAAIIPGDVRMFSFSHSLVEVPPRKGMAGVDAIIRSQSHASTYLGRAVRYVNEHIPHDRLVVVTDEQSHDPVPDPKMKLSYMINVGSLENGVGYGKWIHIDGFSENVIRFIHESEKLED